MKVDGFFLNHNLDVLHVPVLIVICTVCYKRRP